jgi:glycosyltransferase involved in cell wall biosynthesis
MGDAFLALPEGEAYPVRDEGFNLCFTCTFSPDEPVEEVVKAAAELPDVTFYITGESDRLPRELEGNLTDNIILTGFLPDNRFFGLLRSVDGIMSLTTRDFTLQQGGCEAVSVGKPFITSDWPYLREFFPEGTVYVKPTVSSISDGVRRLVEDRERLEKEMIRFREKGRRDWEIQFVRLFNMVAKARS